MRYFLLLLNLSFFFNAYRAQVPQWDWAVNPVQHFNYYMVKSCISVDGVGYTYVLSESRGVYANPSLMPDSGSFLARFDRSGNVVWTKKIPGTPRTICADINGNVYVGGRRYDYSISPTFSTGAFISKYDHTGTLVWEYTSAHKYTSITALTVSHSGKLFVLGSKADTMVIGSNTLTGKHSLMSACFLPDGSPQWARTGAIIPDTSRTFGCGNQIYADSQDNIFITYQYSSCPNWSCVDAGLLKLDKNGNYVLHKNYSGYDGVCNGIAVDAAGDIYMSHCKSAWTSGGSYVLRKYKADMSSYYWEKEVAAWQCQNQTLDSRPLLDGHGSLFIAGAIGSQCGKYRDTLVYGNETIITDSVQDIAILKLDCSTGNYQKVWHIAGDLYDYAAQIDMDILGNIYAVGSFNNHNYFSGTGGETNDTLCFDQHCISGGSAGNQLFVAKLKLSALDFNDNVGLTDHNLPEIRIAPNPTSGSVNFGGVPVNSVEVLDLTGRLHGRFVPNATNCIDVAALNDGVYILRVFSGTTVSTGRLVLIK